MPTPSKIKSTVLYRLPHATEPWLLIQDSPLHPLTQGELGKRRGFLFAPFDETGTHPAVFIEPDKVCPFPVDQTIPHNDEGDVMAYHADSKSYTRGFNIFHEALENKEFEKLVLSAPFEAVGFVSPIQLFTDLCGRYPDALVYLVDTPLTGSWIGATPEVLLESADNAWRTMALAGTKDNVDTPWDEKNQKEHAVVANYVRKALQPLASDIHESEPSTMQTGQLYHILTDFTFHATPSTTMEDIISALHPTPAVCGYPKARAIEFVKTKEPYDREYYSGYLGPVGMNGETHIHVNIRCARLTGGDHAIIYAGSGLLASSTLEAEWEEVQHKAKALLIK